ncbi:MAG: amidohydrolase family protein [Akkermansiaceae bacterium]|nr:amidohydrolase family protein [Armatimonadota bacterium]
MAEEMPFDLMVRFGPVPPRGAGHKNIESVRQALGRYRIYGAALASNRAIQYDPISGNIQTADAARQSPTMPVIVAGAVLDPRIFVGVPPKPPEGTRIYYILPATQGYALPYAPLRSLLKSMPHNLPLYFEARREGDATQIGAILREVGYAGAPVFLGGCTGSALNEAISVAKSHDFVGLTTHGMRGIGEVQHAVKVLGANRVLFASGSPSESLSAAIALVKLAGLPPEERAAVFGANARRLLGIATPAGA